MDASIEQTYVLSAIEQLRNEVIARDDARQVTLTGILDHLKTLNGKTARNTKSVTRLNLVVFGLGGPIGLAIVAAVLHLVIG
jgi:hypothetical protein